MSAEKAPSTEEATIGAITWGPVSTLGDTRTGHYPGPRGLSCEISITFNGEWNWLVSDKSGLLRETTATDRDTAIQEAKDYADAYFQSIVDDQDALAEEQKAQPNANKELGEL